MEGDRDYEIGNPSLVFKPISKEFTQGLVKFNMVAVLESVNRLTHWTLMVSHCADRFDS
jgi:hypothetical protein